MADAGDGDYDEGHQPQQCNVRISPIANIRHGANEIGLLYDVD